MRKNRFLPLLVLLPVVISCDDKSLPPFSSQIEVNRWIYDEMKLWYYWEDKLPATPDYGQTPDAFFNHLLYSYDPGQRPDGDRFSWIQTSANDLSSSLSGETVTYGMEYRIANSASLNKTIGTVLYVMPGSPADKAGLKRGDTFTQVGGEDLTASNFRVLLAGPGEKKITVANINSETGTFEPGHVVSVTPVRFQEDPVHYFSVITKGDKKIGYLVYHQFYPSTNGTNDNKFDKKLEKVFEDFKSAQINELIVDLRYNSGGYVSSANLLSSLIATGVTQKDIFSIKEYNPRITKILENSYGTRFFNDYFTLKSQNVGHLIDRVYLLTSKRTASASELLINGLLPYMEVKIAGDTTVGKNVGSITLSDDENRTNWGLQPIVSKSFNSLMRSDYSRGFFPDYPATEGLIVYPYGDERDPLLRSAMASITATDSPNARRAVGEARYTEIKEITSSLDNKPAHMLDETPDF